MDWKDKRIAELEALHLLQTAVCCLPSYLLGALDS